MLTGLTRDESEEFRKLDQTLPFSGEPVWPTSRLPEDASELRWLELWDKHRSAVISTECNSPATAQTPNRVLVAADL